MSEPDKIVELTERMDAMQRRIEHQIDFSIELLQILTARKFVTDYQAFLLIEGGIQRDPAVVNQFDGMGRDRWQKAKARLEQSQGD